MNEPMVRLSHCQACAEQHQFVVDTLMELIVRLMSELPKELQCPFPDAKAAWRNFTKRFRKKRLERLRAAGLTRTFPGPAGTTKHIIVAVARYRHRAWSVPLPFRRRRVIGSPVVM